MDNLATSALPVSSHEEDNQVSVNAAFYRKLTQQIVQKDNIIKLLRLQVEELNSSSTEGGSSALSYGSSEETESLKAQLDELTRELNEERSRLRTLLREDGFTKEERQELDEQLQVSRQEITSYSAINKSLEHKIKELTAERDSLSLRLVNLSDEFSELSTMEVVSPEDMKLLEDELEESRKEVADLESENKRLHKRLAEAKEELATTGEALAILQEKLETANRKLDSLPDVEKLEEENTLLDETCRELDAANEDLKSRLNAMVASLNETRASSARRFSSSDWRILSGVVQMYDAILHMSDSIPDPDLEDMVFSVFDALHVEKIEAIGTFYDPEIHDAVETVYSTDYQHGLIIGEKSSGYIASGSVIRSSQVVVSNNPFWCGKCLKAAVEGSQFCNTCGEPLSRHELRSQATSDRQSELVALGKVSEKSLDFEMALVRYKEAIALDSCNREALRGIARIEELKGNWQKALDAYTTLEEKNALKPSENRGRRRVELKLEINRLVNDIF